MSEIKTFFDAIPAPIWGIVGTGFGAVLTLAAALVVNSGNNRRLKIQLKHDEKEKNIDRMNTLRREVYMEAMAEMVRVGAYLGDLPNGDISSKNVSTDLQGFYVAAAKLSLVSSDETQKAVEILGIEYSKLIFTLIQRLTPVHVASLEKDLYAKQFAEFMVDVRRVLSEITRVNEAGRTEQNVFSALEQSYNFLMAQAKIQEDKRSEAHARFNELHTVFSQSLMLDMKKISLLQVEVLICIRKDLGIATDEHNLRSRALSNISEISKSVGEAMGSIKAN
ncbi:MAG TPA: hypothetical protein VM577_06280 [Anaerovoracaceae bacterium]|nr:hypothetical protein [Anaerovoracaceae bacterium]